MLWVVTNYQNAKVRIYQHSSRSSKYRGKIILGLQYQVRLMNRRKGPFCMILLAWKRLTSRTRLRVNINGNQIMTAMTVIVRRILGKLVTIFKKGLIWNSLKLTICEEVKDNLKLSRGSMTQISRNHMMNFLKMSNGKSIEKRRIIYLNRYKGREMLFRKVSKLKLLKYLMEINQSLQNKSVKGIYGRKKIMHNSWQQNNKWNSQKR